MKPYSMRFKIIIAGLVTFICAIVTATLVWHYLSLWCAGIFDSVNALRIVLEVIIYIGFLIIFASMESKIVNKIKESYKKRI